MATRRQTTLPLIQFYFGFDVKIHPDWDSLSAHKSWIQSPSYTQFFTEISPLLDLTAGPGRNGAPNIIHLNYVPHPPDHPRSAPITELAFFALARSAPESAKSALEDKVLNLAKTCVEKSSYPSSSTTEDSGGGGGVEAEIGVRATSFATGWVLEDMDHHAGTAGPAISLGLMLGWESKEAHLQAKESERFRRAVQPVRDAALPAEPGRGMYHVAFTRDSTANGSTLNASKGERPNLAKLEKKATSRFIFLSRPLFCILLL